MSNIIKAQEGNNFLEVLEYNIYSVIDDYITEKYSNKNTISTYRSYITKYVETAGIRKLSDLEKIHYSVVRKSVIEFIRLFQAANTKRVVISCLRGFWHYICDVYSYKKNPVPQKINLPPRQSKSTTKSLGIEKLKPLLSKLKRYTKFGYCDHLKYSLVTILATTGLRISEALQITTSMICDGKISVVQKRGKVRTLDLPLQAQHEILEFINKYEVTGILFQSSKKKEISRVYAHRLVKQATGISPHGFRKSVIEILIASGIHNHEVAKVSGHSSINMVFYYDNRDTKPEAHKTLASQLW